MVQRRIPWRVLHNLDNDQFNVSNEAAAFIDSFWESPCIDVRALLPDVYETNKNALRSLARSRSKLMECLVC